jgi:predicted HicB family RNase H-like nuclease
MREKRTQLFTMRMLPSVHKILKDNAKKEGVSASEIVEQLILKEFGIPSEKALHGVSKGLANEDKTK